MVKQSVKKLKKPSVKSSKVDFEPNKMALAVATGAAVSLALLAVITMMS